MRLRLLLVSVLMPLLLWAVMPVLSSGATSSAGQLQRRIDVTRGKIGTRKSKERVLAQDISRYNRRIATLQVTARITARRDELAQLQAGVVAARVVYDTARNEKSGALRFVRSERQDLEGNLQALEKEQAKVKAELARAVGSAAPGAFSGTGGPLSMPVRGVFTSPFGFRWGRLHAGVDIGAPNGTPIHAADSGRVVLLGWTGGYGNYTCIQHTSSMSTCYAHQSRYATSMGAQVRRAQLIGYVGNTGHSFGDHLHFEVRINGNPVDPVPYL